MKVAAVTTRTDSCGITGHHLLFDNGLTGYIAHAQHRTGTRPDGSKWDGLVTLKWGDKYGLSVVPGDWNPVVGDTVVAPPRWNLG